MCYRTIKEANESVIKLNLHELHGATLTATVSHRKVGLEASSYSRFPPFHPPSHG